MCLPASPRSIPHPGFTDEKIHLFLAHALKQGSIGESRTSLWRSTPSRWSEVMDMVRTGEIQDGKTVGRADVRPVL